MGSRGRRKQRWSVQALTPLMEGPDLEMQDHEGTKKESSWDVIREWFRLHKNNQNIPGGGGGGSIYNNNGFSMLYNGTNIPARRQDLRLLLGVLGCPLAPIPLSIDIHNNIPTTIHRPLHFIKDIPIESSTAHYIIQQYLAATGCLEKKQQQQQQQQQQEKKSNGGGNGNGNGNGNVNGGGGGGGRVIKNMYTTGMVKMICCETEISSSSSSGASVKSLGRRSGENGCFVLWQMNPGMWSLELVLGGGSGSGSGSGHHHHKVIAGSDGKIIWRHTPWLGTHLAKGPHRPLRRIIQGLDPKSTARLFEKAQCLGEKRIGEDDCFVLKVAADREAVMERSEGPAEVIRHVLYGYFSQKSGLLIYMEDSHLIRVSASSPSPSPSPSGNNTNNLNPNNVNEFDDEDTMYWETTIGSSIGDYRDVDGVLIAHQGRTIATVFRFGDLSMAMQPQQPQPQPQQQGDHNHHHHQYMSRTRLEEVWRIDDVVFNVPGLSLDSFIPPADIFHHTTTPAHTPLFHSP